ncbi:MAG TPA: DNA alkylation repair protein [bacterium]|nr:DNA alkylation repair protein [bacterium]
MSTQTLLETIKAKIEHLPKKEVSAEEEKFLKRYLGSEKKYLGTKTRDNVKIANFIIKEQQSVTVIELIKLLNQLFASSIFEEYVVGGKIFTLLKPEVRSQIPLSQLEKWLSQAQGWVEVDVICQSSYSGAEVLENWDEWQEMIRKFSASDNISLRRASLVLQNPSVRKTNNANLRKLAFETIEKLKHEKDGLITKSVSWLLRSLSDQNKAEVKEYLLKNEATLPRIAFRETLQKIETGKKNG